MSNDELAQALRLDIINEYEAIIGYEAHAMAAADERVKKVLFYIADQERSHVGELQQLINMLCPKAELKTEQGKQTIIQQQAQNFQQPMQQ